MVTTVSIRLALRKVAEMTCGTRAGLFRVTARVQESRRIYSASVPFEYRDEVCEFLRQQLPFRIELQDSILVLTETQAEALLALTHQMDTTNDGRINSDPEQVR
jgi:hypothetical protein